MNRKEQTTQKVKNANRRHFMKRMSAVMGILAAFEFLGISLAFFNSKPRKKKSQPTVQLFEVGHIEDFQPGSVTAFAGARFFLVRFHDGGFLALSLRCSHLGCSVHWNEEKELFLCPCHASRFDKTGKVLSPPAPRPLDYYPLEIEGNILRVNTTKIVKRNTFEKSQVVYG